MPPPSSDPTAADPRGLTSRDIPDTSVVPWASTGWTNNRNVTQMLEFLMMRGEVAIAGRVGRERLWDVAERVYPVDVHLPSVDEAERIRNERRRVALAVPGAFGDGASAATRTAGLQCSRRAARRPSAPATTGLRLWR